jgi:phosphoribosyl 1,2-cyclic phosphate phosphodiesterase
MNRLSTEPGTHVDLFGARFLRVPVTHGRNTIAGYRFGGAAYLTDMSDIPEDSVKQLQGLEVLVLDALRREPHPSHSHLAKSLAIVQMLKPKRAFFTHISHDLEHGAINAELPSEFQLAHDGLKVNFQIAGEL